MKSLFLLLCFLAHAAMPLDAAEEPATPSPKKKRSAATFEKSKTTADSSAPIKPFITPSPAKKKKPAVSADDDASTSAKKMATPDSDETISAPAKKKRTPVADEDTPPAKQKMPADGDGEAPASAKKKSTPAPLDEADRSELKSGELESNSTAKNAPAPKPERAPAASLEPADLREFAAQPARVQQLLTAALALTKLNLTYTFGSADPARGGMDCSGTIHHLLRAQGFVEVPRDSTGQYVWTRKAGRFFPVLASKDEGEEFRDLEPGDLLFWTGTYQTGREIPISHVMLYLGREKRTGRRVMFGASDGRSYAGVQRWGVSVFDFKMPKADPANPERRVDFVGYAPIPGLRPGR